MMVLAQNEDGQTMILAVLLAQMMRQRCQRLDRELDEGLVHRDAMTAYQKRLESVFRHPNPAVLGAFARLWTMDSSYQFL